MRTTRLARLSISTAGALAMLGAVAGCGLGSGITVVGANPGSGVRPIGSAGAAVSAASTAEQGAGRGASGQLTAAADGITPTASASSVSLRASPIPSHVDDTCTGRALRLEVVGDAMRGTGGYSQAPNTRSSSVAVGSDAPRAAVRINAVGMKTSAANSSHGESLTGAHSTENATRELQLTLVVTNTSHSPCTLSGYPSVDFLRAGVRGPLAAPNSFAPDPKVAVLRLVPGDVARSLIAFTTNGPNNPRGVHCEQVVAVRVYPSGSTTALTAAVHDTSNHRIASFYVCGHGIVVHALQRR